MSAANGHPPGPDGRSAEFVVLGSAYTGALVALFERNHGTVTFDPFPLDRETAVRLTTRPGADRYFGAVRGDELLGMTMLRGWQEGFEVPSFGILIDREHRGRGLGRWMTELTLEHARGAGSRTVRLSVYASNRAAVELYCGFGFAERERRLHDVAGRPDEKLVMYLDLGAGQRVG